MRRICLDAMQRYQQRLSTEAYKEAKKLHAMVSTPSALRLELDNDKTMTLFLSVGTVELCPILVRRLNEPALLALSQGINAKMVAIFVANWILHIPLVREYIAVPETLMLSLNVLTRVANVCLIIVNLYLLLVEEEIHEKNEQTNCDMGKETDTHVPYDAANLNRSESRVHGNRVDGNRVDGNRVQNALTLLDMGLQHAMYEWDATFLKRVFATGDDKHGLILSKKKHGRNDSVSGSEDDQQHNVPGGWRTSYLWEAYSKRVLKDENTEDWKQDKRFLEADVVMRIVCEDVVKLLLWKMLGTGKDGEYASEKQTIENNVVLKKLHAFCPGLVDVLVEKHLAVLYPWFHVHVLVYWPFYVAAAMTATQ